MYHSISTQAGPTSIAPDVFAAQMQAIARSGVSVISLDEFVAARTGQTTLPPRAAILTFDDGYTDFADLAWPVIRDLAMPVTVFLPTGHVGGAEVWRGHAEPPRPLMGWDAIVRLAGEGVDFGGHTVSHPDLLAMSHGQRQDEIVRCHAVISDRIGRPPRHFAPPYGLSDAALRAQIATLYHSSCGTRLGQADAHSDLFDLPRLEMFYYTDARRWDAHLAGRGAPYLALRKGLRRARGLVLKPWGMS
jgi:peptidoglycan/xylan/chitin deacetylase (PgdA/CDA1 family)